MNAQIDRSVPPELGPPPAVHLPPIAEARLANGLRLMVVERHELPLATFALVVPGGSTLNPADKAGVAQLMAEMLTEGTTSRTSLQIADEAAFLGISIGARSSWDATTLTLNTPTAQLDSALALFADIALHPSFPVEEFDRLQKERLTELLQLKDHGPAIANRAYAAILYGSDHPYGRPATGTEQSISQMTVADVRSFYEHSFIPNAATLIVVGDVTLADVQSKIGALFGHWPRSGEPSRPAMDVPAANPTTIYVIDKPGAAQSSFRIGEVGVARSTDDYFPIQVMNTILGGAFTSRLNQNLRETKGYTYGAFSRFDMREFPGPFTASAEIVAAKTDSALVEFLRELRAIRDTVPMPELTKAKRYLALQLPSEFETNTDIAQRLMAVALYRLPLDYYNTYVARIESVTQEAVQRVANQYVDPSHLAIVIVGDRASVEPMLRALQVGPIQFRDLNGAPVR
jgi:predicted Zn-dependent peptidase